MQHFTVKSYLAGVLLVCVSLFLFACGGGSAGSAGSSGGGDSAGVGSVAVLLTDGPAQDFDEVNVSVIRTELFGDDGKVTLFEGDETFNLLDLTDARLFAIRSSVPTGRYGKIRLTLRQIQLINRDEFGNVTELYEPKLPGNGKLDLVPRGDIVVVAGETLVVQIDMDAEKSIHIVGTGSGKYQFRPVVFVDVVSADFLGKFIQVHGVIDAINPADQEFLLCETRILMRKSEDIDDQHSRGCIQVAVQDDTAIFALDGAPANFDALVEGEEATVYGRLYRDDDGDEGGSLRELHDMELRAMTIELGGSGNFQKIDGVAQSEVNSDGRFGFSIDPGQGFAENTQVTVQLQPGTRIINRRGDLLDAADIASGVAMKVDGILDLGTDPDQLNASLVIINSDAGGPQMLTGEIGANPDGACGITLMTSSGDRSIRTNAETRIFLVSASSLLGSSEQVAIGSLPNGAVADVYGAEGTGGCFDASTIIAFATLP